MTEQTQQEHATPQVGWQVAVVVAVVLLVLTAVLANPVTERMTGYPLTDWISGDAQEMQERQDRCERLRDAMARGGVKGYQQAYEDCLAGR